MKICFIAHPSHTNSRSWIRYFANELGHEVHVIAATRQKDPIPGAIIHYLPINHERKWQFFLIIPWVRRLVRRIAPDLLIGYRVQSNGFLAACSGYHPLVLAAQDEKIVTPPDSKLLREIVKFTLPRGDWFNAWGVHMAKHMEALGAPREKIVIRSRGVDLGAFCPPDAERPSFRAAERPTIVTTRGLYDLYRHDVLVAAVAQVVERVPDVRVVLVGRGPEEGAIRDDIRRRGLESNVELAGYVEHRGVAEFVRQAHVYVSVVETEGLSSSLLEAMACGTFPVVIDLESNRLLLTHGKNGLLVAEARPELLAEQLLTALTSPELREAAARENLALIRRDHDWAANMRKMESEYVALVRASRGLSTSSGVGARA
jgi:glycosyltransferase involved in cell wall biosynthesis